jgi:CO dehydrogenase/acetyl-CoA synthase alpha subunit
MFINSNPAWNKQYSHPSLPQDVLITLAVINLDPDNQNGVACKKIAAFLRLYFPYYNRHPEECIKLVRMAANIKPEQETGNENFRIKSQLIPRLMDRMQAHMKKNR